MAVFAGFCGLIPFLAIYWACIPAVLELWLIKDQPIKAALMFGCQLIPMFFVDGLIQEEIKGTGHPYLTGMAIAGGIMCMGLKGAFLGPILLCFLIVAINMYTAWLRGVSPSMWKTTKKKELINIDKDTPQILDSQSKVKDGVSLDTESYQAEGIINDLDILSKTEEDVSLDAESYQEEGIIKADTNNFQDLDSPSKTEEDVFFEVESYQEEGIMKADTDTSQDSDSPSNTEEDVCFDVESFQDEGIIKADTDTTQDLDEPSKNESK
ncbi:uncharacterized protein LOC111085374 [Limulus polyphemus]|uniref:Uncharacterized protein LOC111085374 n=1 Tax=Limulus polyphemus TaxID=6850 RepID=A0ABM1S6U0_LIMPO|nr:uncharacterized protein LOC111085374 [Limulus polyphemus]